MTAEDGAKALAHLAAQLREVEEGALELERVDGILLSWGGEGLRGRLLAHACAHRFVELDGARELLFHPHFGYYKGAAWEWHYWHFFSPHMYLFLLDELLLRRSEGQPPLDLLQWKFEGGKGWGLAHPKDRRCGLYPVSYTHLTLPTIYSV